MLFFKNLLNRLKNEKVISSSVQFDVQAIIQGGPCNVKQSRFIKAALQKYSKIILIFDADGPENVINKTNQMKKHIPRNSESLISIVVLDHEIEEWICKSMKIKFTTKPHKELDHHCRKISNNRKGYFKSNLIEYIDKIDIQHLTKDSNYSFSKFINILNSN